MMKQDLVAAAAAFAVMAAIVPGQAQAGFVAPVRVMPMPVRVMPMPAPVRIAPPPPPVRVAPPPAPAPVRVAPAPAPKPSYGPVVTTTSPGSKPVQAAHSAQPTSNSTPGNKFAAAGAGGAGKPPLTGKPAGSGGSDGRGGGNSGGNGAGRGYVPRHGTSEYHVQSNNNWLLWYMLMNNSNNAHAHSYQAAGSGYVAEQGYQVRSFVCEPGSGQLAKDWVRQCERPSGHYQIEFSKGCTPQAAELAPKWVQRCGTRLGADW